MDHNPISIIIPYRQVVGTTGSLTGYIGGIDKRIWLLKHEGAGMEGLSMPKRETALQEQGCALRKVALVIVAQMDRQSPDGPSSMREAV